MARCVGCEPNMRRIFEDSLQEDSSECLAHCFLRRKGLSAEMLGGDSCVFSSARRCHTELQLKRPRTQLGARRMRSVRPWRMTVTSSPDLTFQHPIRSPWLTRQQRTAVGRTRAESSPAPVCQPVRYKLRLTSGGSSHHRCAQTPAARSHTASTSWRQQGDGCSHRWNERECGFCGRSWRKPAVRELQQWIERTWGGRTGTQANAR